MTPEATASRAFKALRSDVEQFDDHPAQGDSGLFSEKVPLALKSYLVNWLRRFMAEHGDVVEATLSAPPSKEALRDVERETLERAAKVADEAAFARRRDVTDWTGNEADPFACTGWEYAIEKAPGWRPWDDAAHARAKAMEADGLVKECGIAAMPPHVVYCITRKGEDALLKHCAENF